GGQQSQHHQPAGRDGQDAVLVQQKACLSKIALDVGLVQVRHRHHTALDDARCLDPSLVERLLPRFQAAILKALGEA
ncbi:MAG: hypothetical protein ACKN9P_13375, partial [Phenylobacterium sp.]